MIWKKSNQKVHIPKLYYMGSEGETHAQIVFHWIVTNFYGCGSKNKERWDLQSSNKLDASYTKATAGWVTIKANHDKRKSKCWYSGLWKLHLAGFLHNFPLTCEEQTAKLNSLGLPGPSSPSPQKKSFWTVLSLSSFIVNYFNHAHVLPLFLKTHAKLRWRFVKGKQKEFSKKLLLMLWLMQNKC